MKTLLTIICLLASVSLADAATYYVQNSPGSPAANCTQAQSIDTPHDTIAEGVACLSAGDTLYLRSGTYAERLVLGGKDGTPGNYITIGGYPGETVTLRPALAAGNPAISGSTSHYITIQDLVLDGVNMPRSPETNSIKGWWMDSISNWIIQRMEIKNFFYNGIAITSNSSNIIIRNNKIHDQESNCVSGTRWYGIYVAGTNYTIENNEIYNNPGGGVNVYPGPVTNFIIRRNNIHDNNSCTTQVNVGGILVGEGSAANAVSGVTISENTIHHNGSTPTHGGAPGINIFGGVDGTRIINNSIYANNAGTSGDGTGNGYGILLQTLSGASPSNTTIINNIVTGNQTGQINVGASTGTSISYSACLTGESCGATNKITLASSTACFVSSTNLSLAQGTNPCRNAGTSVAERPAPVGTTDVGAYEQGAIVSAVVAGSHIEATVSAMSGIQPGAGLTGLSLTCVTCTGTPVLLANPKPGSTNTIQISVSGLTGSGTARLNLAATNITDSGYVGPSTSSGIAQGLNSLSALDITGTVDNTTGDPTPPAGGLYSEFLLDEGSGETANDTSGNANHGTVSTGVTWVDDTSGTGVYIPTAEEAGDSTYRHIASTHGSGVNPTDNSISTCVWGLPDTQYAQKVPLSAGSNSPGRLYAGWFTAGGAQYWGMGIGASTMTTTGASEFPLLPKLTLICLRANAETDTAVLSVDRTIGTSAAAVKSIPSFALPGNIRAGNDGTNTINTGGFTVYGMWVWNNTYISDADVQALYDSLVPAGGSVGGYAEVTHRWQKVYLNVASNPDDYLDIGTEEVEVMENGAVAIEKEVGCSGGPCGPVAFRLYVSDLAGNEAPVPQAIGAGGIGMWGNSTSSILNRGVSTCCLTEGGTPVNGVTILDSVATNTVELCDGCKTMFRWVLKVGAADRTHILTLKQDNGAALDGVAGTTPRIKVVPARASGVR